MLPKGSSTPLLFLISYLLLLHAPTTTADTLRNKPIKANCMGDSYAANSRFQTNLGTLFSTLSSQSSHYNSDNATVGTYPNRAYGLYLCEGDLAHSDCQACIQTAITDITQSCPAARQAIIWYDYCLLRYSDRNFFGVPDITGFSMVNPSEPTNSPVPFQMVSNLVQEAPYRRPLLFASNASVTDSLYAMAQCTVDLNSNGCSKCLKTILAYIKSCCTGQNGWRYLAASCWIRYEATPFLRELNGTPTEIIQYQCSKDNFPSTALGTIKVALNSLLSDLTSEARPTGFYNAINGEGQSRLYGLALCRADLAAPSDDCSNCLNQAGSHITGDCPNSAQAVIWYEKCLLRYSNESFFGVVDYGGRVLCGLKQVTREADDATLALAMSLIGVAANRSTLLFAAGEARVSDSQSSYVLAQCTRDLSSGGCAKCLQNGMSMITKNCRQLNGWRYLSGSCTIRFEAFPFFNTSVIAIGH